MVAAADDNGYNDAVFFDFIDQPTFFVDTAGAHQMGSSNGVGPRSMLDIQRFRPKTEPFLGLKSMFLGSKRAF